MSIPHRHCASTSSHHQRTPIHPPLIILHKPAIRLPNIRPNQLPQQKPLNKRRQLLLLLLRKPTMITMLERTEPKLLLNLKSFMHLPPRRRAMIIRTRAEIINSRVFDYQQTVWRVRVQSV